MNTQEPSQTSASALNQQDRIQAFFHHLFDGGEGFICVASKSSRMKQEFFHFPSQTTDAAQHALRRNRAGEDVYVCVHLLTREERKKEWAGSVHTLWADGDGAQIPEGFPEPTLVVESSPGRHHYYWRLTEAITPARAETLNRKIAEKIGADLSGWDMTQLLRVPGTKNHKYNPPAKVRQLHIDESAWDSAAIESSLPDTKAVPKAPKNSHVVDIGPAPVPLFGKDLLAWEGREPFAPGEKRDRSTRLSRLACTLRKNGASEGQIVEGLRYRDSVPPFEKYAGRPDADDQYEKLASWAVENIEPRVRNSLLLVPEGSTTGFELTDLGNAERLASLYESVLRFSSNGEWLVWDGARWRRNPEGARRLAAQSARAIRSEAEAAQGQISEALRKHANRSEAKERIGASLDLAKLLGHIQCQASDLDGRDLELNLLTGTVDLPTGTLKPHDARAMHTRLSPIVFDPTATCRVFDTFLEETFAGDAEMLKYIQRLFGYCLTGSTKEQVFFLLHGGGANGKSTLVNVLMNLLGEYASQLPTETLLKQNSRSQTNDLARLEGVRVAAASEFTAGRSLDEALIKQLTGGERVTVRALYRDFIEFEPKFKILISSNYLPEITGFDQGIWRRVHLIPFAVTVPESSRDGDLGDKLRAELPGILNWALTGASAWHASGLQPPPSVRAAVDNFRQSMDSVGMFFSEMCEAGDKFHSTNQVLWTGYETWCDDTGRVAVSKSKLFAELKRIGFEPMRTSDSRGYKGFRVRTTGVSDAAA